MSKKSKKSVKPAAPQVKKTAKPKVAPAKSGGAKLLKKALAPEKKATPPKPVAAKTKPAKKPLTSPAITAAAAAAGSAARAREGIAITAQLDIGFGNLLFLRGEGGGLSWESGTQLECAFDDQWTINLVPVYGPVTFKFLINDLMWSEGENIVLEPGTSVVLTPTF